jgi:hypothetical protein
MVGIEAVVFRPLGSGLIREIALGHANVVRAEDALTGTGIRFGQNRDGRDATEGSNRAESQPLDEFDLIEFGAGPGSEKSKARDYLAPRKQPPTLARITLEDAVELARVQLGRTRDRVDDRHQLLLVQRGIELAD